MIMIEPLESRIAPAVFIVTTVDDSGPGTLRQALLDANANPGFDTINFNIPGPIVSAKTILLETALPAINGNLLIDGYSQAGSSTNTAEVGTNAEIRIALDGSNFVVQNVSGLVISGGAVTVRGLAIHGFLGGINGGGEGIAVQSGASVVISGCFIGIDADGKADANRVGIGVKDAATNVLIGDATLGGRNVISGNRDGIEIAGAGVQVQGNLIGTGFDGVSPLPNLFDGILTESLDGGTIGGDTLAAQNVIAHNGGAGISVTTGTTGLNIRGNSFFSNGGLAIDLVGGGGVVTPNDPSDADVGPNGLQNFPEITGVTVGGLTEVFFRLQSSPNTAVRVDLYSSVSADSSGFGEGRNFLGSVTGMTDANGQYLGSQLFLDPFAVGTTLTATATNLTNLQTSEFSRGFNIKNVTISDDRTATWTDADGDQVTLKLSKGSLDESQFFFSPGNGNTGALLQMLQLRDVEFNGTNVAITVKKAPQGDGRVSIGYIDATGNDLAAVNIKGDLGRITCGDLDSTTTSLKSLKVNSMGLASGSILPDGIGQSRIVGPVGSVLIATDLRTVSFEIAPVAMFDQEEFARTVVSSFKVGGDILATDDSRALDLEGSIKRFTVGGKLISAGEIYVKGDVGKVTIGEIYHTDLDLGDSLQPPAKKGALLIKGDIVNGSVQVGATIGSVSVQGSLIGTNGALGFIQGTSDLASVSIRGDVYASADTSAGVGSTASIGKLRIGGSLIKEVDTDGDFINSTVRIQARTLGAVSIGGSVLGNATSPVTIGAIGNLVKPATGFDLAIGSVKIAGSASHLLILAGLNGGVSFNADASIGSVSVGKNWVASSIAAGVEDKGAPGFGAGDLLQEDGDTTLIARIASITIGGNFLPGEDALLSYGFAAEEIVKLRVAGVKAPVKAGPSNDSFSIWTFPNLALLEVP